MAVIPWLRCPESQGAVEGSTGENYAGFYEFKGTAWQNNATVGGRKYPHVALVLYKREASYIERSKGRMEYKLIKPFGWTGKKHYYDLLAQYKPVSQVHSPPVPLTNSGHQCTLAYISACCIAMDNRLNCACFNVIRRGRSICGTSGTTALSGIAFTETAARGVRRTPLASWVCGRTCTSWRARCCPFGRH